MREAQQFVFRALIALDATGPGRGPWYYSSPTCALKLRAAQLSPPTRDRLFPAEVRWTDQQPLRPGDRVVVTITVADDDAGMFFAAGQRFTLWDDRDIGHGTVSRQILTGPPPG